MKAFFSNIASSFFGSNFDSKKIYPIAESNDQGDLEQNISQSLVNLKDGESKLEDIILKKDSAKESSNENCNSRVNSQIDNSQNEIKSEDFNCYNQKSNSSENFPDLTDESHQLDEIINQSLKEAIECYLLNNSRDFLEPLLVNQDTPRPGTVPDKFFKLDSLIEGKKILKKNSKYFVEKIIELRDKNENLDKIR